MALLNDVLFLRNDPNINKLPREISAMFNSIKEWDTKEIFGSSIGDYSDQKIKIAKKYIPISLNISGQLK